MLVGIGMRPKLHRVAEFDGASLIPIADVADIFDMATETVRGWCRRGLLPFDKDAQGRLAVDAQTVRDAAVEAIRIHDSARARFGEATPAPEPAPTSARSGVYLVRATGTDIYKIGVTTSIGNRLSSLRTSSPLPIELVAFVDTDCRLEAAPFRASDSAYELESSLHRRHAANRLHGEWFRLTEADAADVAAVIKGEGAQQ